MDISELKKIVAEELHESNGCKLTAIKSLQVKCELDDELMIAFAKYGNQIFDAIIEKQSATLQ